MPPQASGNERRCGLMAAQQGAAGLQSIGGCSSEIWRGLCESQPASILFSLACAAEDTGRLKTEVNPGRARVFIDGKYAGPAANLKIACAYEVRPASMK